jgi:hypothetical protein
VHSDEDPRPADDDGLFADELFLGGRERRREPRHGGNPVPVLVREDEAAAEPYSAVVIDRSAGGLGLSLDRPLARGTLLRLRPTEAPDATPWVAVEVRNCWPDGPYWEVGCCFREAPAEDVLKLFG